MKEYFFDDFLRSNLRLSAEQRDVLFEHSMIKEYDRGDFILSAGETCAHRFFIERGAIREYSIDPRGRSISFSLPSKGGF